MIHNTDYSIWLRIYTLPIIVAFASCSQLIFIDYPYGHDWIFELVRLSEYFNALKAGQVPPYWSENLYSGFGSPIFLFYAPLYNLITSLFLALGITIKNAAIISLMLLMIAAAIGMAGLMWEINRNSTNSQVIAASRIAAIAYILSPYLLSNLLVRNASAELTALCLAPYPFWGLFLMKRSLNKGFILLSVGLVLSILSHNLTALVIATLLIICSACLYLPNRQYQLFKSAYVGIIIGIGISSWFWLPALILKNQVNIHTMTMGKFDFHNNFSSIIDLFNYNFFYSAGLLSLFILLISFSLIFSRHTTNRNILLFVLCIACAFILLQLNISVSLWETLPFLSLFQFPWRMMGPYSLCIAILLGLLFLSNRAKNKYAEPLIILLIILNAVMSFVRFDPLPDKVSNHIDTIISSDGIIRNNLAATVLDEYLPKEADKSVTVNVPLGDLFILEPDVELNFKEVNQSSVHFEYSSLEKIIIYPAYWKFPVWDLKINDQAAAINKSDRGTLQLELPSGDVDVKLSLKQPAIRTTGFIVSLVFIGVFLFITLKKSKIT